MTSKICDGNLSNLKWKYSISNSVQQHCFHPLSPNSIDFLVLAVAMILKKTGSIE